MEEIFFVIPGLALVWSTHRSGEVSATKMLGLVPFYSLSLYVISVLLYQWHPEGINPNQENDISTVSQTCGYSCVPKFYLHYLKNYFLSDWAIPLQEKVAWLIPSLYKLDPMPGFYVFSVGVMPFYRLVLFIGYLFIEGLTLELVKGLSRISEMTKTREGVQQLIHSLIMAIAFFAVFVLLPKLLDIPR